MWDKGYICSIIVWEKIIFNVTRILVNANTLSSKFSPWLFSLDFNLRGYSKSIVYETPMNTIQDLRERITCAHRSRSFIKKLILLQLLFS